MSYISLYRKWRPSKFSEVVGQRHIVRALTNAVVRDQLAHAYLFCGPRGTGKTSMARILAKSVNCLSGQTVEPSDGCRICESIGRGNSLDVIELDAASNRGIDDARELRENVKFAPSECRKKFYIIDEAHMLTPDACNALLKTIEEPPDHLVFILATTDPHKLIPTIISRCQRYDFARLSEADIITRLTEVSAAEGIKIEAEVLQLIARVSKGSLRDALGALETVSFDSQESVTVDIARDLLGCQGDQYMPEIVETIASRDHKAVFLFAERAIDEGYEFQQLLTSLIEYMRRIAMTKYVGEAMSRIEGQEGVLDAQASRLQVSDIYECVQIAFDAKSRIKDGADERVWFELALIKMIEACSDTMDLSIQEQVGAVNIEVEKKKPTPEASVKTPSDIKDAPVSKKPEIMQQDTGGKVLQKWQTVLDSVKKAKISTYTLLLECFPKANKDGIELHFHKEADWHRGEIDKEPHCGVLQEAIKNATGLHVKVAVHTTEEAASKKAKASPVPDAKKPDETKPVDIVQLAKDSFQAIIVEEHVSSEKQPDA